MSSKKKESVIRYLDTIQPVPVKWLAKPFLPLGKFSLLIGDPGVGKSTLAVSIAAALSTGRSILESDSTSITGSVLFQSAEDNVADTLKPRLLANGADCSKIAILECGGLDISEDCQLLDNAIRDTKARILLLDPLQAFIGKNADMCRAADMRRLLSGLAIIAERRECAVLAIGHMTKATGTKSLYRGLGSIDIAASARSVMLIERSEDEPEVRILSHIKSSLAPEADPLAFRIENNSTVRFLGTYEGELPGSADVMEDGKREWASSVLLSLLSGGPRASVDILSACTDAGISERTLNRAKKDLGIRSFRIADGWYWTLENCEMN